MGTIIEILQAFSLPPQISQFQEMGRWAYFLLAALVAVEGPIITLLGASAASAGILRPELVFGAAALGNLVADLLWYSIGYLGKEEWVFRFGKRFGVRRDLIEKLREKILEHAVKMLFLAKLTVSMVIPSLVTAGLLKLPMKRWLPPFLLAETLWTGSLVLIGFYTTEAIKRVERGVEYVILVGSILFVIGVIVAGRRFIQSWNKKDLQTPSQDE